MPIKIGTRGTYLKCLIRTKQVWHIHGCFDYFVCKRQDTIFVFYVFFSGCLMLITSERVGQTAFDSATLLNLLKGSQVKLNTHAYFLEWLYFKKHIESSQLVRYVQIFKICFCLGWLERYSKFLISFKDILTADQNHCVVVYKAHSFPRNYGTSSNSLKFLRTKPENLLFLNVNRKVLLA